MEALMLKCSVPLCEKCENYDWEHTAEIREVFLASGLEEPKSIWCKATDRPEDLRWEFCANFAGYGYGNV